MSEKNKLSIEDLLRFTVKHKASDLHISAGMPAMIRTDGEMTRINMPMMTHQTVHQLIYDIMNDRQRADYEEFFETDFSFEIPGLARFRVNAFNQNRGAGAVFRTIPSKVLSMDDLGMGEVFKRVSNFKRGVVLVTGPTGSGKSTTLAAMIDYINDSRKEHILTIEDPIEFVHESKKSLVNQREVHRDTLGFDAALRSALREDPDVILVGELRDLETIRLALSAAETGHLVFGTVHTTDVAATISRIVQMFPTEEQQAARVQLLSSLRFIIAQQLLPKLGGGRVAAREFLVFTPDLRKKLLELNPATLFNELKDATALEGITMMGAVRANYDKGLITPEVLRRWELILQEATT